MLRRSLLALAVLVMAATVVGTRAPVAAQQPSQPAPQPPPNLMVRVGDIDIAYRVLGNGEPLLMIMGYAGTMDIWDPTLLQELAARYMVIIFDNRGMGGTSAPPGEFTIGQFAEDTAGLIAALRLVRVADGGHGLMYQFPKQLARVVEVFISASN